MYKSSLLLLALAVSLTAGIPAAANKPTAKMPQESAVQNKDVARADVTNRVAFYSAWDEEYFYLFVQVNKPVLTGKNDKPFSNPIEDDAVVFSVQTDNDHKSTGRTAKTFSLAISAKGGTQLYQGEGATPLYKGLEEDFGKRIEAINRDEQDPTLQQMKVDALLRTLIKAGFTAQGAKRPIGAPASGYTVEIAIPWVNMGGRPAQGAKMGFNVVAQSIAPGSPTIQSLSAGVKTIADTSNPSLWGEIAFNNDPAPLLNRLYTCPRVFANKPLIDGELTTGEWSTASFLEFGERVGAGNGLNRSALTIASRTPPKYTPRPMRPALPLMPYNAHPLPVSTHKPQNVPSLVFASYRYDYQADTRKAAPAQGVAHADGGTLLALHPSDGAGAWFSYDRADWHRRMLTEARSSGVDVLLPVYRSDTRSQQLYARKGLIAMVTALEYMRQEGIDYPQIGLQLDTTSLIETLGERPDLREPKAQEALYTAIRDFYCQVPSTYRYTLFLNAENGGRRAAVVFLAGVNTFRDFDGSFVDYVRGRFLADFGEDLVLMGTPEFKTKAPLDGYFQETREKGFQFEAGGWISVASVGAGYDNSLARASSAEPTLRRSYREGETYRDDWKKALENKPNWILLDGWNDFTHGAATVPTVEYGTIVSDVTRLYTRYFSGSTPISMKFLAHDTPSTIQSGQTYVLNVRVQNTGMVAWGVKSEDGVMPLSFIYRWKRKEEVVAQGSPLLLSTLFLARANDTMVIPVATMDANKQPLPEGEYTLEVGALAYDKLTKKMVWIGDVAPSRALQIPVKVSAKANAFGATLIYATLPRTLESGGLYEIKAMVRNDGGMTWKASEARISLHLYRTETVNGAVTETLVPTADASAVLEKDVPPGQETTLRITVPIMDAEGKPLPLWTQEQNWMYTVRWEVSADKGTEGAIFHASPVALIEYDFGAKFIIDATPSALPGERRLPVRISIQNGGTQTWRADSVRVGYHWYYRDGTELIWEDEATPLPIEVAPGKSVDDMLAMITAPSMDGVYWLVWDVKVGDTWLSTTSALRAMDTSVRQVRVIGGKLTFTDLTKHYNVAGVADMVAPGSGDFDGKGRGFPAELLPPFAEMAVAPVTLWQAAVRKGPESPRRISFRMGQKGVEAKSIPAAKGQKTEPVQAKNFIAAKGQKIELGASSGQCRILHILAASSGNSVSTTLGLIFAESVGTSEDQYAISVSPWNKPPMRNELVAFHAPYTYTAKGAEDGEVSLYHYQIKIRDPRKLIAINLPNAPDLKIAAISLEK